MHELIERSKTRPISIERGTNPYAHGSVIISFGNTKVHITATVEENVPSWLKGQGKGWVTAEYNMLPGSTHTRSRRERNKVGGRTYEIQRLIARSLRGVIDLELLGETLITLDCDVLVADGGTRTASISGAYVALEMALLKLLDEGRISKNPIKEPLAAISIGVKEDGKVIADLNYEEDFACLTDMNIVMTKSGEFIEVQGTAEEQPFSKKQFDAMIECAELSLQQVFAAQESL